MNVKKRRTSLKHRTPKRSAYCVIGTHVTTHHPIDRTWKFTEADAVAHGETLLKNKAARGDHSTRQLLVVKVVRVLQIHEPKVMSREPTTKDVTKLEADGDLDDDPGAKRRRFLRLRPEYDSALRWKPETAYVSYEEFKDYWTHSRPATFNCRCSPTWPRRLADVDFSQAEKRILAHTVQHARRVGKSAYLAYLYGGTGKRTVKIGPDIYKDLADQARMYWGGDYTARTDPMHFE